MSEEKNPLVRSGEYAPLFAADIPAGAGIIGFRDNDVIVTAVDRYSTRSGAEMVRLHLDDGRTDIRRAGSVLLVRNHSWQSATDPRTAVSGVRCEVCGLVPESDEDRMRLCDRLGDES